METNELELVDQQPVVVVPVDQSREIRVDVDNSMASVLEAQAKAVVAARYAIAMRKPRNLDDVRVAILRECRRPNFARIARYRKPIGKGIEGMSVRFVEAALRCMTNCLIEATTIYESADRRVVRVSVCDLESNLTYPTDISIEKTVERQQLGDRVPLGQRRNSRGEVVYVVAASEDEVLTKTNALISKAIRSNGLRLIPGDILDEAETLIKDVVRQADAADPDGARKAICDAFAGLGIKPSDLGRYLKNPIEAANPEQLAELRALYTAIRDGEAKWSDALALVSDGSKEATPQDTATKRLTEKLDLARQGVRKKKGKIVEAAEPVEAVGPVAEPETAEPGQLIEAETKEVFTGPNDLPEE